MRLTVLLAPPLDSTVLIGIVWVPTFDKSFVNTFIWFPTIVIKLVSGLVTVVANVPQNPKLSVNPNVNVS